MIDLSTPDRYYHNPGRSFVGSGEVSSWLDGERLGSHDGFVARYLAGPMLDIWRANGQPIPPQSAAQVKLIDFARVESSAAMRKGALLEVALWSPDNQAELAHAEGEDYAGKQAALAWDEAALIVAASQSARNGDVTVGFLLAAQRCGALRTQVGEGVQLRDVPCRRRVDLQWTAGEIEVDADFKRWSDLQKRGGGVERCQFYYSATVQATFYRMVGEALHPGIERASGLLVVDPSGLRPMERWHVFPEELIEATRPGVERALDGIRTIREQTQQMFTQLFGAFEVAA